MRRIRLPVWVKITPADTQLQCEGFPAAAGGENRPVAAPARVFLSYSHTDKCFEERIVTKLCVLQDTGRLRIWEDRGITASAGWRPARTNARDGGAVALLLISSRFLNLPFLPARGTAPIAHAP